MFQKQIDLTADELEPGIFDILNKKLKSMSNYEDAEAIAERWSALRRRRNDLPATARGSQGRGKEPEKQGVDKILERRTKGNTGERNLNYESYFICILFFYYPVAENTTCIWSR